MGTQSPTAAAPARLAEQRIEHPREPVVETRRLRRLGQAVDEVLGRVGDL